MPITEINSDANEVKILLVEPLRKITAQDINTATGINFEGSQLQIHMMVAKAIIGKDLDETCYLGFDLPSHDGTDITINRGVIITENAFFQVAPQTLTPTPEAHFGIFECEFVEENVEEEARDFWDASTEEASSAMSPTRKRFAIKIYENYNTTASYPTLTPGRFELLRYEKAGAFQPIVDVFQPLTTDFDLTTVINNISQLYNEVSLEVANRQVADDLKNYIRTTVPGPPGNEIYLRQDGNYLYWSNDGVSWRPFG